MKTKINAELLPVWLTEGEKATIQRGDFVVVVNGVVHGVMYAEDVQAGFPLLPSPAVAPAPAAPSPSPTPVSAIAERNQDTVEADILDAIRVLISSGNHATAKAIGDELGLARADKAGRQLLSQLLGGLKKKGVIKPDSDARIPGYIAWKE